MFRISKKYQKFQNKKNTKASNYKKIQNIQKSFQLFKNEKILENTKTLNDKKIKKKFSFNFRDIID